MQVLLNLVLKTFIELIVSSILLPLYHFGFGHWPLSRYRINFNVALYIL